MEFWARRRLSINLLGVVAFIAAAVVLLRLADVVVPWDSIPTPWQLPFRYVLLACATLLVTRFVDRMPVAWSGLGIHRWTVREITLGAALGAGMALAAVIPIALIGGVRAGSGWGAMELIYLIVPFMVNAAGEEILLRGYLFQRLVEITGPVVASLASALVFAVLHLNNPNASAVSTIIIFFGGIFFALAYLRTGSLWFPIGAHVAWNMVLGNIAGLPVSGHDFGASLFQVRILGPDLLTGGAFGPEGGLVAVAALAIGIAITARHPAFTVAPYANAAVFRAVLAKGRARRNAA